MVCSGSGPSIAVARVSSNISKSLDGLDALTVRPKDNDAHAITSEEYPGLSVRNIRGQTTVLVFVHENRPRSVLSGRF